MTFQKSPKEVKFSTLQVAGAVKELAGDVWLPSIYAGKVRTLRTRAHQLGVAAKENKTEIQYTLLGVELKVSKQRITCPDLATARFLQVFARLGCAAVAIPYDITKISVLADELESAWQRSLLLLGQVSNDKNLAINKSRAALVKELRREIEEIGAGAVMPEFNQNTKQRINKK